jgi:hypothetical protein
LIGSIVSAFLFGIAYASTRSLWWLIVLHAGFPMLSVPAVRRAKLHQETRGGLTASTGL